ncbi:MAG: nitrilase-related carbon-nitrogen hydrolase [Steroidobacteraceae bacterium]
MNNKLLDRYFAVALQTDCDCVHQDTSRASAEERMLRTIRRIDVQVLGAKRWLGEDLRLLVLPEYVLTGPPWGESIAEWRDKAALDPDGREYGELGAIAARHGVYLAGNAYETDRHFPGLYFQACFVFDPSGKRVLGYRRLISVFAPTPHDVWDRYLDVYGLEGVFPVADTPLGKLATIASEEILYPEVARCFGLRGAEVLLHPSSEVGSPQLTQKQVARRARAQENMAYLLSANTAVLRGIDVPWDSSNGYSDVIDYLGKQLAVAGQGESMVASAMLDMAGLRAWRSRPGMGNFLARQALDMFVASFAAAGIREPNGLLQNGKIVVPERSFFQQRMNAALARLAERGITR